MGITISPKLAGLLIVVIAAYLFMYEFPNLLGYPFNFVFAGTLIVVLFVLAAQIIRQ
ncbi:MAG: hypothetical protein M1368_07645 [Thaumarchaeota archaeon]|nr:hypothetical protein [Nitrososphaerota archaeon]